MVFSSIPFLFFFFPLCLLFYYLVPFRKKNTVLLIFSLIFYSWGEPVYIFLMLFTSFVNYYTGIKLDKKDDQRARKRILALCIIINLGLLGFFKYTNFFIEQINGLTGADFDLMKIALPIGISFYTFQNLSYSIDIYRKRYEVERKFSVYLTYITMFPQLIAGPIVRFSTVRNELHQRTIDFDRVGRGVERFMLGLFKKVLIADNVGALWETVRSQGLDGGVSVVGAWIGAAAFTLQLYFDFSGYSDMAIGMGDMLGFNFDENFNYPLSSVSVTDFWRRWHISLSSWFRDYVYIPLGGNRKGKVRTVINLLIVWALTGFWHGAAWNFMFWGLYYGVLLILEKNVWGRFMEKWPKAVKHIYTLLIVVFGFVIFVFDDTAELAIFIRMLFGMGATGFADARVLSYLVNFGFIFIMAWLFSFPVLPRLENKINALNSYRAEKWYRGIKAVVYVLLFAVSVTYIVNASYSPFLYFRF